MKTLLRIWRWYWKSVHTPRTREEEFEDSAW